MRAIRVGFVRAGNWDRYLRDLVRDGYAGTLRSVRMHVSMNYFQATRVTALRWTAPAGNFSSAVAIYDGHFLDMLFALLGDPEAVPKACAIGLAWSSDADLCT